MDGLLKQFSGAARFVDGSAKSWRKMDDQFDNVMDGSLTLVVPCYASALEKLGDFIARPNEDGEYNGNMVVVIDECDRAFSTELRLGEDGIPATCGARRSRRWR